MENEIELLLIVTALKINCYWLLKFLLLDIDVYLFSHVVDN